MSPPEVHNSTERIIYIILDFFAHFLCIKHETEVVKLLFVGERYYRRIKSGLTQS